MSPSPNSALPADLLVPPGDRVIPVEEWDWTEIGRLEDHARHKLATMPRCEDCGQPMVCGQTRAHFTCRPPTSPPQKRARKLASR